MSGVVTLTERKQARADEIRAGFGRLRDALADYGRAQGGRFWVYGSSATGDLHFESDIDVLVDFEPAKIAAAIDFVEGTCTALRLKVDVQPKSWCTPEFLKKVLATAVVLP
jgi:predicted nucleotidyltransferase